MPLPHPQLSSLQQTSSSTHGRLRQSRPHWFVHHCQVGRQLSRTCMALVIGSRRKHMSRGGRRYGNFAENLATRKIVNSFKILQRSCSKIIRSSLTSFFATSPFGRPAASETSL